jgi:hypothetical protein
MSHAPCGGGADQHREWLAFGGPFYFSASLTAVLLAVPVVARVGAPAFSRGLQQSHHLMRPVP